MAPHLFTEYRGYVQSYAFGVDECAVCPLCFQAATGLLVVCCYVPAVLNPLTYSRAHRWQTYRLMPTSSTSTGVLAVLHVMKSRQCLSCASGVDHVDRRGLRIVLAGSCWAACSDMQSAVCQGWSKPCQCLLPWGWVPLFSYFRFALTNAWQSDSWAAALQATASNCRSVVQSTPAMTAAVSCHML